MSESSAAEMIVIDNGNNLGIDANLGMVETNTNNEFNKNGRIKKKKKNDKGEVYRNYNPDWEVLFGFLKKDNKTSVCALNLCQATMSHRSFNIKRHFTQTHQTMMEQRFGKTGITIQQQIREQVAGFKLKNPTFRLMIPVNKKGYNPTWTSKYGFVMKDKEDSVCTLCNQIIASKSELLELHFKNHITLKHLPKSISIQEHIHNKVKAFTDYHGIHWDMASSFETRKASLIVALAIAKMDKTYLEGEFIRDLFLQMSEVLFSNYTNRDEIIGDIKRMSISRASIRRNIDIIVDDINQQLNDDLEKCDVFSIRLDQSVSRKDLTRLAITARFYSNRFQRLIDEVLMVGRIQSDVTKESDSIMLVSTLVEKFPISQKLFSICIEGARQTTAQIFIIQLQQMLNREILVFNTTISLKQTFEAILNEEQQTFPVPIECSPIDIQKTLKFALFPEQFYYNSLEGNFLDFNYFKFLEIETYFRELDHFGGSQTLMQQFQQMRQEIFNNPRKSVEILLENWNLLKKPEKTMFGSMLKVFGSIMSIFSNDADEKSNKKKLKKKLKNNNNGLQSSKTDGATTGQITIGNSIMNPYRNRLKMNNTEIAFRLNLTNYSPDFNRILIKRRPLTFEDVIEQNSKKVAPLSMATSTLATTTAELVAPSIIDIPDLPESSIVDIGVGVVVGTK